LILRALLLRLEKEGQGASVFVGKNTYQTGDPMVEMGETVEVYTSEVRKD
jgi:hypothetical protein